MSIADPIREKGRELHSLARKLSEHLGGRDHREWSGAEIQAMMKELHNALGDIEDHLDMDSDAEEMLRDPSPGAPSTPGGSEDSDPGAPSSGAGGGDDALPAPAAGSRGVAEFLSPSGPPATLRRRAADLSSGFGFRRGVGSGETVETDDVGPEETAHASTLEDFFGRVGDSLITAQRQLDSRARGQLAEGGDPDLATLYRIPKVSAELKFALQEVGKGGINLLIYRQGTEASTLNQQTVQFEIAAVPAPPETVAAVRRRVPHLDWVLDTPTRDQIREALAALPGSGSQPVVASKSLLLENFDHVLVVRDPRPESGFFLAFADRREDHHVGAWHLHLEPPSLTPLIRFELRPKSGEEPKALRDLVSDLGAGQATLLQGL